MRSHPLRSFGLSLLLPLAIAATAAAAERQPAPRAAPQGSLDARVIVAYRAAAPLVREQALAVGASRAQVVATYQHRADVLARRAGVPLKVGRAIGTQAHVVTATGLSSSALAAQLRADPNVEYAVVDQRRRALMVPSDPLYAAGPAVNLAAQTGGPAAGQWYLRAPTDLFKSAINAEAAWDVTTGSPDIVVAVLDTGVRYDHVDLQGRLLSGYDFISDAATANDGGARDADANDPGDWITAAEDASGPFKGCGVEDSSWHGTQTSALIGAATNNGLGMAGIAHGARLLPVRVLGKCGGYDSDILAGMLWAAGIDQAGLVGSRTPARVLNMSLGGDGACSAAYADAVAQVTARGAVVVAAAGNSAGHAVGTPANCAGVIGVAGLRHAGTKVGFSDLGPEITIGAPGGNCVNVGVGDACLYPILTASNSGTRGPNAGGSIYTDGFDISVGTSFSAPIVSGTLALMLSARPELTPAELTAALKASARPYPTSGADNGPGDPTPVTPCLPPTGADQLQCYCTTALCGAGMVDAAGALAAVTTGLYPRIAVSPAAPVAGSDVQLSGAGTLVGAHRSVATWAWTLVNGGGIVTAFSGATNASTVTLQPVAPGTVSVRLAVTDDLGATASTDIAVTVAAVPVVAPPSTGSGSGGGAVSWAWLGALALAAAALQRVKVRPGPGHAGR